MLVVRAANKTWTLPNFRVYLSALVVRRSSEVATDMDSATVLVTGASGFVAKHCIAKLLMKGFKVRGTVRDLSRAEAVRKAVTKAGAEPTDETLAFIAADLDRDAGWDGALQGCRYVMHVASPFPIEQPAERRQIVTTARDGTLRVLRAADRANVERIVMTSSTVAVMYARREPGHVFDETDWTDAGRTDITPYIASKTLAERAAWDYIHTEGVKLELAVINPAFVQGPALDDDISTSLQVLVLMAKGVYPAAPRISFPICDVRDVARAHVTALTTPEAAGQRFIVASGELPLIALGELLAKELPDLKSKVPKFELPDIAVRAIALFDRKLRSVLPELGEARKCSAVKVHDLLGVPLTPAHEAVREAARSLRALGVI